MYTAYFYEDSYQFTTREFMSMQPTADDLYPVILDQIRYRFSDDLWVEVRGPFESKRYKLVDDKLKHYMTYDNRTFEKSFCL